MRVLGIESSCDETAVAIYEGGRGILAHQVYSQIDLHAPYGGVVPELAARDHLRRILPLINELLEEAKLSPKEINAIAYTQGPGLVGALMVGASFAKSLAYAWQIPALGVHHMEAHLVAASLVEPIPPYPFIALLVSGGHTLLLEVKGLGQYRILGESLDDAVGEAFDKTAKLLGLPYPGGPELARLATRGTSGRFEFPRPMLSKPGLDFSFSGLKTHAMNCIRKQPVLDDQTRADIALAFEEAVVETLVTKSKRAMTEFGISRLVMVGGVSANTRLRSQLKEQLSSADIYYPPLEYCTDNGAMVAYLGYLRMSRGEQDSDLAIKARARWPLSELA